jgi:hypothetical protein
LKLLAAVLSGNGVFCITGAISGCKASLNSF